MDPALDDPDDFTIFLKMVLVLREIRDVKDDDRDEFVANASNQPPPDFLSYTVQSIFPRGST